MPQQQQGLSMASLGPQGGGVQGPSAAMRALQDMAALNQQQLQKSAVNVQRMQQEADQRMQMQAQQMQSGVMDVANQVAGGIQKMQEERKQRTEKVENVKLQEDMMIFQQKLAQEAAAEGQRVGTLMKNAQDATMNAIKVWGAKGEQMATNIQSAHAVFDEMWKKGKFRDIPGGYKKAEEIWKTLKSAEAYHEDAFNPSYLSKATRMLADAERDIAEGRDPTDLAAFYDKPDVPQQYGGVTPSDAPDLDGKTRFELSLRDGYPKDGVYSLPVDDPRRQHMKVVTPDVMAKLMVDDASYSALVTDELREKWMQRRMRDVSDGLQKMEQMATSYEQVSDMMFSRSPEAIRRGLANFSVQGGDKFGNTSESVVNNILREMFPESGDQILALAKGIRDRSVELDTAAEFSSAMTLEAAASAIESRVIKLLQVEQAGSMGADAKGKSRTMMSDLADQWAQFAGPQNVARTLGGDAIDRAGALTPVGLAKAQLHVQGMLEQAKTYAGELRRSLNESGAIRQFSKQFGTEMKIADIYLWKWLDSHGEDRAKAQEMLYGQVAQQGRDLSLGELDQVQPTPSDDVAKSRSIIDSTLEFIQTVQPSQLPLAAALLSGGQVDLADGRVEAFNAGTQDVSQRNEYMMLVQAQLKDRREIEENSRRAREAGMQVTPEQVLQERKMRQSKRAAFAEQLRRAKGSGGISGAFRQGLTTLGALGGEAVAGMTGTMGPTTGFNYGE